MRKQDNSKLIYLLIGVVAVFILVFQYKSWCSAAEFEIVEKYSDEVEEAISSIPLEEVVVDDEGVSEFISEAPILGATSETVVQNFDDSAIVEELKKSNEYWEMFLDSFSVDYSVSLPFVPTFDDSLSLPYPSYAFVSVPFDKGIIHLVGTLTGRSSSRSLYIYYFNSSSSEYLLYNTFSVPLGDSVDVDVVVPFSDSFDTLIFKVNTGNLSGFLNIFSLDSFTLNYSENKSYTLSELGNAVIQNGNNVSEILVYVLITCCFVCCFISLQIAWHTRSQIRKWSGKDSH